MLIRMKGTFGLIATNSISEGDTRRASLMFIRRNGGEIYSAIKRLRWPGLAVVLVSLVHCSKGVVSKNYLLDGRRVSKISSYLVENEVETDPYRLLSNNEKAFGGVYVYGNGFMFDDENNESTPLAILRTKFEQVLRLKPVSCRKQDLFFQVRGRANFEKMAQFFSYKL